MIKGLFVFTSFLYSLATGAEGAQKIPDLFFWIDSFRNGQNIPQKHVCNKYGGGNISPGLRWSPPPTATQSFVILCQDFDTPHAPSDPLKIWDHWVVYNIPKTQRVIQEGSLPKEIGLGVNSNGNVGYDGPCPPPGQAHRYYFRIYALNTTLRFESPPTKDDVFKAMGGHVIAQGEIMGTFNAPLNMPE